MGVQPWLSFAPAFLAFHCGEFVCDLLDGLLGEDAETPSPPYRLDSA
jgi:hypothetical protein